MSEEEEERESEFVPRFEHDVALKRIVWCEDRIVTLQKMIEKLSLHMIDITALQKAMAQRQAETRTLNELQ